MTDTVIGALTLTDFSEKENSKTWVLADHTVAEPRLVIQKRRQGNGANPQSMQQSDLSVVYGTSDSDDAPMSQKINISVSCRSPVGGQLADLQAAVDAFQVLVASAAFDDLVEGQLYVAD
jgi:hypothetical protein